mmetsp:Transcript_11597/g.30004  ORF Transcript_11597/g.30004 Transcript_11597/m.30004 type:complete len:213 (-) Transcript_11597:216-854(-)
MSAAARKRTPAIDSKEERSPLYADSSAAIGKQSQETELKKHGKKSDFPPFDCWRYQPINLRRSASQATGENRSTSAAFSGRDSSNFCQTARLLAASRTLCCAKAVTKSDSIHASKIESTRISASTTSPPTTSPAPATAASSASKPLICRCSATSAASTSKVGGNASAQPYIQSMSHCHVAPEPRSGVQTDLLRKPEVNCFLSTSLEAAKMAR